MNILRSIAVACITFSFIGSVFAIDFTDRSGEFTDAPFQKPEAVAISVLKNIGIIDGNPDGTFAPNDTLTRAAFIKIIILSSGPTSSPSLNYQCFPDIDLKAWYAQYICEGKARGVTSGYPDGLFHPERSVNYAEALKMLANHYAYPVFDPVYNKSGDAWYAPFQRLADLHGTALPENPPMNHLLTRGEMARLTAAFKAESEGVLEEYRMAEQGK